MAGSPRGSSLRPASAEPGAGRVGAAAAAAAGRRRTPLLVSRHHPLAGRLQDRRHLSDTAGTKRTAATCRAERGTKRRTQQEADVSSIRVHVYLSPASAWERHSCS